MTADTPPVRRPMDDAAIDRQWEAIERRRAAPSGLRWPVVGGALAVVAAVVVATVWLVPGLRSSAESGPASQAMHGGAGERGVHEVDAKSASGRREPGRDASESVVEAESESESAAVPDPEVAAAEGGGGSDEEIEPGESGGEAGASGPASGRAVGRARQKPDPQLHRSLWSEARDARRRGDYPAAEAAYVDLLERFPKDGLAALELGRLRMDVMGNTRGAIGPLKRALSAKLGGSFREDAMARLVSAYDSTGQRRACERVRDKYLHRFPSGAHHQTVGGACVE